MPEIQMGGELRACCLWHLIRRFSVGHATWCRCGNLLVLRDGEWRVSC